jgi:hypothetical protein
MKKTFSVVTLAAVLSCAASLSAAGPWTGTISDAACGRSHDAMTERGKKGTDKDCTLMCVKGGSAYVFVNEGKVLKIANQDFKGLQQYAGAAVRLTGELKGDSITITQLEQAK